MSICCHPLEARRLLSLTAVGSETALSKAGVDSELAVAGNGTFIVANLVVNQQQTAADLVAQRYSADGSPIGSQLTLDSLPYVNGGFLADLSVDMDADGDAVVVYYHSTWGTSESEPIGDFVKFVRISKTGVVSSPTLVAESENLQVDGAAVSMDDSGGFFGGSGNDRIYGGASGDWLYGAAGADQLFGEGGLDRLYADDQEFGDSPWVDTLHGNAGDDILIARDGFIDLLFGDGGHDTSFADHAPIDSLVSIETIGVP